jgi:putative flavoprotein involved in K+ transport
MDITYLIFLSVEKGTAMVESIETVIIGAGQAGLSAGYILKQYGLEYIILERAGKPGDSWRSQRWDSFTFVSPNWTFQLPGGEYDGLEPDGFMTRDQLVDRFDAYVEKYQQPITYNTRVTSIRPVEGGSYLVQTQEKEYLARNVVVATGWFQVGKTPPFAGKIPASILQFHSSKYRNPQSLPPGAVLVAGSGQSGAQIAEELNQSGRKVFLATGVAPHLPRRYRGKDAFRWLIDSGFTDQTFEQMQFQGRDFVAPMLSGKNGGHGLNLHKMCRDGVILLGHATDYVDGKLILAPDLKENLGKADMGQKMILKNIDAYIQRAGLDAPLEDLPVMMDGYQAPGITALDLQAEGINTIIWACGYSFDASIFQFPVLNPFGLADAPAGISVTYPGVYFAGFPFLPTLKTGFIAGLAQSATHIVESIEARKPRSQPIST